MSRYVIMGVAGCGKSTVGAALQARCGLPYLDGDDLHPAANIGKMSRGEPLNDEDRAPWLDEVGTRLATEAPAMIGCSSLKRRYRDRIRARVGAPVLFLHLAAPRAVIERRMAERRGHFMPPSLLDSQFAALEPLELDETGAVIDIARPLEEALQDAARYIEETKRD